MSEPVTDGRQLVTVLTGANSGIGLETARQLRRQGHDLILTVRTQDKADQTRQALEPEGSGRLSFVLLDLADPASVQRATGEIRAMAPVIDRLINNAGYIPGKVEFNEAGYEKSFVANHLGPFVLTLALMDRLLASTDPRVITISSAMHYQGSLERMFLKSERRKTTVHAYSDGKLANVFFARCLAREYGSRGLLSFSLHPGVVRTGFASGTSGFFRAVLWLARPFMIRPERGAETSVYLATALRKNVERFNGAYFDKKMPFRTEQPDLTITNDEVFWEKTEQAVLESGFSDKR